MAQGEGVGAWHARDPACHWPASLSGNAALATTRRGQAAGRDTLRRTEIFILKRQGFVVECSRRLDDEVRPEEEVRACCGVSVGAKAHGAVRRLLFHDDGGRHKFPGPLAQKVHQSPSSTSSST
jgi:hypothetical protein